MPAKNLGARRPSVISLDDLPSIGKLQFVSRWILPIPDMSKKHLARLTTFVNLHCKFDCFPFRLGHHHRLVTSPLNQIQLQVYIDLTIEPSLKTSHAREIEKTV